MSAEDYLEIGQARTDEADAVLRLMCEAFGMSYEAAKPVYYSDPYFRIENKIVVRDRGKVVSCLTVVDRDCRLEGAVIKLAGIAGVATTLSCRRQGLAGRLLANTVSLLAGQGFHLSALFPIDRDYYRRFGWETAGVQSVAHVIWTHSDKAPALSVRRAEESDIASIADLYERAMAGRSFYCLRDEQRWRYLLTFVPEHIVMMDAVGKVVAYALYEYSPVRDEAKPEEKIRDRRRVRLLELHGDDPDCLQTLRNHLIGDGSPVELQYALLRSEPVGNRFTVWEPPIAGFMARIIDWEGLLKVLSRSWPAPSEPVGMLLVDPLRPPSVRAALVTGIGGRATTAFPDPAELQRGCADIITGDVGAWSAVAVGRFDLAEACRIGALQASSARAISAAAPYFPARDPFISAADHF